MAEKYLLNRRYPKTGLYPRFTEPVSQTFQSLHLITYVVLCMWPLKAILVTFEAIVTSK